MAFQSIYCFVHKPATNRSLWINSAQLQVKEQNMSDAKRNNSENLTLGDSSDLLLGMYDTGMEGWTDSSDRGSRAERTIANEAWTSNSMRSTDTIAVEQPDAPETVYTGPVGPTAAPIIYETPSVEAGPSAPPTIYETGGLEGGPTAAPIIYETPSVEAGPSAPPTIYETGGLEGGPKAAPIIYETPSVEAGPSAPPTIYETPGSVVGLTSEPIIYTEPDGAAAHPAGCGCAGCSGEDGHNHGYTVDFDFQPVGDASSGDVLTFTTVRTLRVATEDDAGVSMGPAQAPIIYEADPSMDGPDMSDIIYTTPNGGLTAPPTIYETDGGDVDTVPDIPLQMGTNTTFVLNDTSGGNASPGTNAGDAFQMAADLWSLVLGDDVTVNLDIGFDSLNPGVLAQAGSERVIVSYADIRAALGADATSADDATAVANLVGGNFIDFETLDPDGFAEFDNNDTNNNQFLSITKANAKALGITQDANGNPLASGPDANITFSSNFTWDFDPTDGIDAGAQDFVGVAFHEIGHALGFTSGVDIVDAFHGGSRTGEFDLDGFAIHSTLDLFRFSATGTLDFRPGGSDYFSVNNGATNLGGFSTGREQGDGQQASHWKDGRGLGVMDPTANPAGNVNYFTNLDLQAFDVIGWDLRANNVVSNFPNGGSATGTSGNDIMIGAAANDTLTGGDGDDTIVGNRGNDRVFDGRGDDTVLLGEGNDYVRMGGGRDTFDGGSGRDFISYYDAPNGVTVNLRTDSVSGSSANDDTISNFESVSGSRTGDDTIYGTTVTDDEGGNNTIRTYGGNDRVFDYSGDDTVELGDDNDYVRVGGGRDSFDGGDGVDYISYYGSSGGVRLDFENDTAALSWARDDTVVGFESASGSRTGGDDLRGDGADTVFRGYGGDDRLLGRGGNDRLYGGNDRDSLFGGDDDDELYGENGDDFLHGGKGLDDLYGGSGIDRFHFDRGDGNDVVHDFENNIDILEFDNFRGPETASVQDFVDAYASEQGRNVVFDFGADGTLTILNISLRALQNDIDLV